MRLTYYLETVEHRATNGNYIFEIKANVLTQIHFKDKLEHFAVLHNTVKVVCKFKCSKQSY